MNKALLILIVLISSNLIIAQTTAIPDANFEDRLISLGYDNYPINGSIPTSNINTITSLDINSQSTFLKISDLTGIEDFTALQTLICHSNLLTTLDLSSNLALTDLICRSNQISTLNITNNIALTNLNCWSNQLTSLDVTNNVNLTTLICMSNQLTSLDLTNNTSLDYLTCSYNQLTGLHVANNTALTYLTISNNLINNIDVTNLSALNVLDCDNNQLTILDLSNNTNLALLECRVNQLTLLNIANGNNTNVSNVNFEASNNPFLTCIQVDNVAYSTANWTSIDAGATFSTNCNYPCIPPTGTDSRTACNLLVWIDGNTYTSNNNTATHNIVGGAANGCDSLVTLNLTLNSNTGTDSKTECDSLTWIDGFTYTSNNNTATYNIVGGNANGCDSLVTLNLTINNSSTGTDTRTECSSLVWIDGFTYTTNNNTATHNIVGGSTNGCDSLVTLDLTISNLNANYTFTNNGNGNYSFTNTSTGNFNQSHWAFGDGIIDSTANTNHTFTTNGNFTVILTIKDSTVQGDSCISYYLDTINVTGVTSPLQCNSGFVIHPDTTGNVTIINNSTGNNLTYLWNFGDGNTSPLQNPSHTYATAGPFYLCLTIDDGNGCNDMYCDSIGKNGVIFNKAGGFNINVISTPITTGINNIDSNSEVSIYPNPTSNQLTIDAELKISEINIIDITGKIIMITKENTNTINVAGLSNGIYFIQLITENRTITKKFVKQ